MDPSQVSDRLVGAAAKVLAADAAAVLLLEEATGRLSVVSADGIGARSVAPLLNPQEVRTATVAAPAQVMVENRSVLSEGALPESMASAVAVSLATDGLWGVLQVYGAAPHQFTSDDLVTLQSLADLGAVSIRSAQEAVSLRQVDASKSQFIRVATHELRSPVAVSQSLVRTVMKGYAGPLTEKQQDIFNRVAGRLDALESLVNDLLDLAASKAEGLSDEGEPVAVNASVGRAILLLQPRAEEKDVSLIHRACCEELVVWGTEEGLDRIFVNLVDNAIKYTPSGGRVVVSLGRTDGDIFVRVEDTGIGIPEDALPNLFEEFYRAPNAKEFEVGTGLGLAIVKDLTNRYDGEIEVKSTEGEGTTFTVTFPICFLAECTLT